MISGADLRVTFLGVGINAVLIGIKLGVGIGVGSLALVADGLHSLLDLFTDGLVFVGIWFGRRPPDKGHPYGHGKAETLAGNILSLVLVAGGAAVLAEGLRRLGGPSHPPALPLLLVAALSLGTKEILYRITRSVARSTGSPALEVNAWHHRSDAFSSGAVLLGGAAVSLGFGGGDAVASLGVGVIMIYVGIRYLLRTYHELLEGGISPQEEARIVASLRGIPGIRGWHALRARKVGRVVVVDLHITVDPTLSVREAHEIATEVERRIAAALGEASVTVHVEPDEPAEI